MYQLGYDVSRFGFQLYRRADLTLGLLAFFWHFPSLADVCGVHGWTCGCVLIVCNLCKMAFVQFFPNDRELHISM